VARAGFFLTSPELELPMSWPATGLAVGAVLVGGLRVWPAILLGAFAAHASIEGFEQLPSQPVLMAAAAIAVGNTLEALVIGYLIRRWSHGRATFETPDGVARFALIALGTGTLIG